MTYQRCTFEADQIGLEELASTAAAARAAAMTQSSILRGEAVEVSTVAAEIRTALPRVAQAIQAAVVDGSAKGRRKDALDILREVDPDVAALIGLNAYFSAALAGSSLSTTARNIGRAAAVEHYASIASQCDRKAVERLVTRGRSMGGRSPAEKALARIIQRHGRDVMEWDEELHLTVAEPILAALDATGMFELVDHGRAGTMITLAPAVAETLERAEEAQPWTRPRLLPMVTRPEGWEDPDRAPYLTESNRVFVRAMGRSRSQTKAAVRRVWASEGVRPFRQALDALGQAAYRVDGDTLDAIEFAYDHDLNVGGLPMRRRVEPAMPDNLDDLDPREKAMWWGRYYKAADLNTLNKTLGAGLRSDLSILRILQNYPEVYQPHYADFRGRLYPTSNLSHHREDYIRASFRFADPSPLGDDGMKWLAIHLANSAAGDTYGKLDKAPWRDRVDWVHSNHEMIVSIASTWKDHPERWASAGGPFAFLQACREWSRITSRGGRTAEQGISKDTTTTAFTDLIVGLDGTCSGLQHYAAALRSTSEGSLVNLVSADRPQDVYQAVADEVSRILSEWARSHEDGRVAEASRKWLTYGVSRGSVKRQTMTFPYSSETYGFADQIRADTMEPLAWRVAAGELAKHPLEMADPDRNDMPDGGWKCSLVLAQAIWKALQGVVVKAAEGMAWLKQYASTMAANGHYVTWTSPSGVPVIHAYREIKSKQVQTFTGRRAINLRLADEGPKLDANKQRSAIAPNLIHSMDAAHLHLTTARMRHREGVEQLAMIHDSFGTTPGHCETLARVLREEFVSMYRGYCPFQDLYDRARSILPEEALSTLRSPPAKGDLDLDQVLASPYFFC